MSKMSTFNGFKCFWTYLMFSRNLAKSIYIKDKKLNVLIIIINMRILNGSDHELRVQDSVEN